MKGEFNPHWGRDSYVYPPEVTNRIGNIHDFVEADSVDEMVELFTEHVEPDTRHDHEAIDEFRRLSQGKTHFMYHADDPDDDEDNEHGETIYHITLVSA